MLKTVSPASLAASCGPYDGICTNKMCTEVMYATLLKRKLFAYYFCYSCCQSRDTASVQKMKEDSIEGILDLSWDKPMEHSCTVSLDLPKLLCH